MSYIGKIQSPDYFVQLVAKTKRDDANLITRCGPVVASDEASSVLLLALSQHWPTDEHEFDELNIATAAPYDERLRRALADFLELRYCRRGGGRALTQKNERDVLRWILGVVGRDIGGLHLRRNAAGWCRVEVVR